MSLADISDLIERFYKLLGYHTKMEQEGLLEIIPPQDLSKLPKIQDKDLFFTSPIKLAFNLKVSRAQKIELITLENEKLIKIIDYIESLGRIGKAYVPFSLPQKESVILHFMKEENKFHIQDSYYELYDLEVNYHPFVVFDFFINFESLEKNQILDTQIIPVHFSSRNNEYVHYIETQIARKYPDFLPNPPYEGKIKEMTEEQLRKIYHFALERAEASVKAKEDLFNERIQGRYKKETKLMDNYYTTRRKEISHELDRQRRLSKSVDRTEDYVNKKEKQIKELEAEYKKIKEEQVKKHVELETIYGSTTNYELASVAILYCPVDVLLSFNVESKYGNFITGLPYDYISDRLFPFECKCGNIIDELLLHVCSKQHLCCGSCLMYCDTCKDFLCKSCGDYCKFCDKLFCKEHSFKHFMKCDYCSKLTCKDHNLKKCNSCGKNICIDDCMVGCSTCNNGFCKDCVKTCQICNNFICHDHEITCNNCNNTVCINDYKKCDICGKQFCSNCMDFCQICNKIVCKDCKDICDVCDKVICLNDKYFCSDCGKTICEHHMTQCIECNNHFCLSCIEKCDTCEEPICLKCAKTCEISNKKLCSLHSPSCSECNKIVNQKYLMNCTCGKEICTKCVINCGVCNQALCSHCETTCEFCDKPLCEKHVNQCSSCYANMCVSQWEGSKLINRGHSLTCYVGYEFLCENCSKTCPICKHQVCENHMNKCSNCGQEGCLICLTKCSLDDKLNCSKCSTQCHVCENHFCNSHLLSNEIKDCEVCSKKTCKDDFITCKLCQQESCKSHFVSWSSNCNTCRSLKRSGKLKFQIHEENQKYLHAIEEINSWNSAKNQQYRVYVGETLRYRIVIITEERNTKQKIIYTEKFLGRFLRKLSRKKEEFPSNNSENET